MARRRGIYQAYVAYEGKDRPLCAICGGVTRKCAVFFDTRRRRPLCARCAVLKMHENALERGAPMPAHTREGRVWPTR
jgi:hypothetical protein